MLVIGLTGGIGSGKTTVANLFAQYNVPIIDADIIAREVIQPHQPAFAAVIEHFGESIRSSSGDLDRAKLRQLIFNDDDERKWLENLLHPLIEKEIEKQVQQLDALYCIVVIPLLLEVQPYPFINRILVVDTLEHLQIERVKTRDKVDIMHVTSIIKTQMRREDRNKQADDLIINDGNMNDLVAQVKNLHDIYLEMSLSK